MLRKFRGGSSLKPKPILLYSRVIWDYFIVSHAARMASNAGNDDIILLFSAREYNRRQIDSSNRYWRARRVCLENNLMSFIILNGITKVKKISRRLAFEAKADSSNRHRRNTLSLAAKFSKTNVIQYMRATTPNEGQMGLGQPTA
jgi:hypothetical protein